MLSQVTLDDKAWRLLQALQTDGRLPLKALAHLAGLSIPATAERLRRLEEAGVLQRVVAEVDPARVGYPVSAFIGITVLQPAKKALIERLAQSPEVLECHHVTGNDSYVMRVVARDLPDLERFIGTINPFGETRTSIIFSTPIPRRGVQEPPPPNP